MPTVEKIKPAAELRQTPPPFVPSQSPNPPSADEEAQLRALFQQAAASGQDSLDQLVTLPQAPAPQGQPPAMPAAQPSAPAVPQKFLTPQGTVDEEKLKASSMQLDGAIQQKQKTVDELMTEYKEKERKLHELGQQKSQVQAQVQALPPVATPHPIPANDQDMQALHQRLLQDMRNDPVGTSIMLTKGLLTNELAPIMERFKQEEQSRSDEIKRGNLAQLAQADPRILQDQYWSAVNQVLDEDPAMYRLKNPHKAAWNEVKERLRLGEAMPPPAQPSSPSPTLGRGAPPSVSQLPGPASPQTMNQQAVSLDPYSDEGKRFEEQLKEATRQLWQ